jgi:hypothetical protein
MRIAKHDIPTKIDVPGAVARQAVGFGAASTYGALGAEYFSLGAGTDIAPLLQGLDDDLFYWPPGHSVRVVQDAEVILFSPQVEHGDVMDHMLARMAG